MRKVRSVLAVAVVSAVFVAMPLSFTQVARATGEWHLALNDDTTHSGDPCPSDWNGVGDYLIGSFSNDVTGALFRYSYNNGDRWEYPGSPFGDELYPGFYWFSDGHNHAYQMTWRWYPDVHDAFIINAYNVIGIPDFTCLLPP